MNLTLLLDMAADGFGDRIILGSHSGGVTAAALQSQSLAGAALLTDSDADALVYLGVNGPLFPASLFAAARAGVPLVPLNYRLGDEQLAALLANHTSALAVADPAQLPRLAAAGVKAISLEEWRTVLTTGSTDDTSVNPGSDAVAVLIYTSGTTSTPKGVVIRHSNLASYVLGTVEFGSADETDAALISVPPYHIAAVANAVTNLYAGRRSVVLEQFMPSEWLAVAREESVTNALVVPTMLARIMEATDAELHVPSLRAVAYGGAAMPPQVIERALAIWPSVDFVNAYGLTETSSTIAVLGAAAHRAAITSTDPAVRARLSSAGQVLPTVELQVRDDDGTVLSPGSTGRIWVRGEQVSGEYAGSGPALDPDGFFDTRDRGRLDDEGYLFIEGRADDTIIRGGENVAPAEIEDVLLRHPAVVDAVVVGIPDEEWGSRIAAAVVLRAEAGIDPEALRQHVRDRLRSSKTPDRIEIWDELPRTDTGKLIRREAQARLVSLGQAE